LLTALANSRISLAARALALREQHGFELYFHAEPALRGCFGDTEGYLPRRIAVKSGAMYSLCGSTCGIRRRS